MDFRLGRFIRRGLLVLSVPLVGCWQSDCLSGSACAADGGMFSMPTAGEGLILYEETLPQEYVIPPKTAGETPVGRPRWTQTAFDQQQEEKARSRIAARADTSAVQVRPPGRPPSAILVARRAEEHIRYALVLAERGAAYSAQAEFTQVLRLVSQTLDHQSGTQVHSRAMVAGLRALREADDFAAHNSNPAEAVDLAHCIAAHRTPVLQGVDTTRVTPMDALQQYHTFACQQLALAGGREPAASMALYGLARLQSVLNVGYGHRRSTAGTNAMALHQAALAVNQHNYMAANELAVLLARYGEMPSAEALLHHSLSICESSETWHNLSVLYQETGVSEAARWARQRRELYAASPAARGGRTLGGSPGSTVYWVDAATLARSSGVDEAIGPAMPTAPPTREQHAEWSPQRNTTDTARPGLSPASSGLGRLKAFIGLSGQDAASRNALPKTSQTRHGQGLR